MTSPKRLAHIAGILYLLMIRGADREARHARRAHRHGGMNASHLATAQKRVAVGCGAPTYRDRQP